MIQWNAAVFYLFGKCVDKKQGVVQVQHLQLSLLHIHYRYPRGSIDVKKRTFKESNQAGYVG